AIDLKDGNCVRLKQGIMKNATVYGRYPGDMAKSFEKKGAQWIHVVDLNGAFEGKSINEHAIKEIVKTVKIPIQLGGGIRTMNDIDRIIELGISRVILGTAAVSNPDIINQAVKKYGEKIAVGIDVKDGKVAINGWAEKSIYDPIKFAMNMKSRGIRTIIYTDISKDGMMQGPNIDASRKLIEKTKLNVIVSGGVSKLSDILKAKEIKAVGVITGKAIYTNAFSLEDALKLEK
ncbi:MAG: 1-(5-phosphoribosyl)-5-[(5-phosphoribosylamino)methylideneamino]imidazole-4-carboxamide isomerase, partial [Clostridiales bacterium]|nr:1-(5-phosphoribosyl)-5-[(5-phosphoribosylamino)methylideneamino]imidazole-4-carboxamide isomerase [Clostridiales bacterium]